ncbi:MAG: hypothetical protein Q8R25_01040 [bacterium]|nr:hypothetical protein [bacterium]
MMNFRLPPFFSRRVSSHSDVITSHTLSRSAIKQRWLIIVSLIAIGFAAGVWWNYKTFRSTFRDSERSEAATVQNTVSDEKLGNALRAGEVRKNNFESILRGGSDVVPDPSV